MSSPNADDEKYQNEILVGVSRTFALTIPQLPDPLRRAVSNAYLLCRIADTIEDDPELAAADKRRYSDQFIEVVEGTADAGKFAQELHPHLSREFSAPERDLVLNTPRVIRITHDFNSIQRQALNRCVRIMAQGMSDYQDQETTAGLASMAEMDRYCYYVAGVVGEMLTELFCDSSAQIAAHRDTLMELAVSFGQGLQMTNILKDIFDDRERGACWLPRDVFARHGVELAELVPGVDNPGFRAGLGDLIAIAKSHLNNALTYALLIPRENAGLRRFCLWAVGMAVLTLRKLDANRDFSDSSQVKISRRSVKATVLLTNVAVRHDWALKRLFKIAAYGLPEPDIHEKLSVVN